jgi:hypothetical protein
MEVLMHREKDVKKHRGRIASHVEKQHGEIVETLGSGASRDIWNCWCHSTPKMHPLRMGEPSRDLSKSILRNKLTLSGPQSDCSRSGGFNV